MTYRLDTIYSEEELRFLEVLEIYNELLIK